jgi:hypothetical protein
MGRIRPDSGLFWGRKRRYRASKHLFLGQLFWIINGISWPDPNSLAEFNTKSIKRVKQRLDHPPHYYAEKLLDSQLAFTEFPNAIVNQNQFSGSLSIDPGFIRRVSGGLACWPPHDRPIHGRENSRFKMTLSISCFQNQRPGLQVPSLNSLWRRQNSAFKYSQIVKQALHERSLLRIIVKLWSQNVIILRPLWCAS